jgi:hypothetical protein
VITAPVLPAPDFSISVANPNITIQTQHHTTVTVTLTSLNGLADAIAMSCGNPPAYVTCKFTPGLTQLTANGTAGVSLYLDTDSVLGYALNSPARTPRDSRALPVNFALLLSPVSLLGAFLLFPKGRSGHRSGHRSGRRLRMRGLQLLVLTCAVVPLLVNLTGCTTIVFPYNVPPSAAPGTYTLPITGTSATNGISHTTQVTLTITP